MQFLDIFLMGRGDPCPYPWDLGMVVTVSAKRVPGVALRLLRLNHTSPAAGARPLGACAATRGSGSPESAGHVARPR